MLDPWVGLMEGTVDGNMDGVIEGNRKEGSRWKELLGKQAADENYIW